MNHPADERATAVLADSVPGRFAGYAIAVVLAAWTNSRARQILDVRDESSQFWWTVAITAGIVAVVVSRFGLTP